MSAPRCFWPTEVSVLGEHDVIAFVATAQPEKARAFYEDVLGLRFVSDDPVALLFDAHGTTLRIAKVTRFTPQQFTVLGWSVPDIDAAVRELAAKSVTFERYPGLEQDAQGVWSPPGGGQVAWFRDPDGNLLSLTQS